ncbi:hypothetical protein Tco_0089354 [Tanacetum coccineum]
MKKMNEKPGHVRPANGFYDKLNAMMFVPQKELSGDQVYWLSAKEIASQASKPTTPATTLSFKKHFYAVNAIFEINKLRDQLQGKDTTIRNLDAQINIMKVLNVGSTEDGLKVENVSLKRKYDELSKANTHSRTAYTEKINALTAENAKLKTELSGKKTSGSTAFEKPKVTLLPGVNARRAADHNRKLNFVDHNQFVIPWRPTGKIVGSVKPQWKPTGRHFTLYDNCPLTRIMEPIVDR